MSKALMELREKRNKAVADARELNEKARAEKRELTAEEDKRFNDFMDEQEKYSERIKKEERLIEAERQTRDAEQRKDPPEADGKPIARRATKEYNDAFNRCLRANNSGEMRALQSDIDTDGGFLMAPTQFVKELIVAIKDQSFIRANARIFPLNSAQSMGAPSLDADIADADWTAEIATGNEDSALKFGRRDLKPYPLAKRIKVSAKLIRGAAMPTEEIVRDRLAYKFAITLEKAYLLGDGNNKPLGLFQANNVGIGTSRDVSTDNTTTAFTMDGLINAKYSLKAGYLNKAQWLFHRDGVRMAAKLKDSTNQYLWEPSKKVGEPDMLLGVPVMMSEYVPNTFTTGQYVGLIGNFDYYWIADALDMQIQVLNELYAETNQVGYIGRFESDGMPVLGEAFARVKLG